MKIENEEKGKLAKLLVLKNNIKAVAVVAIIVLSLIGILF